MYLGGNFIVHKQKYNWKIFVKTSAAWGGLAKEFFEFGQLIEKTFQLMGGLIPTVFLSDF